MIFAALFTFLLILAVCSDVTRLKIPNWISLAMIGLFTVFVISGVKSDLPLDKHLMIAAAVLAGGFGLFVMGWMGAGDAKLLAAVSLFAGPEQAPIFLYVTALAGGAVALFVKAGRFWLMWDEHGDSPAPLSRYFPRWVRRGLVPYGVAIGVGGLLTIPTVFF